MSRHSLDAIKVRIEASRDAASRSRFALLATTVAALSFLIAEFNAYLSWNREFPLAPNRALAEDTSPTGLAQRRLVSDWVDSTSMNINLLGIHVSASDATMLGGAALFFLTLWFYYSIRRENRVVGTLLRDTRDADVSIMDLVFSGVVSYMVFTAINPKKRPTSSLADPPFGDHPPPPEGPKKFRGVQLLFWLAPLAIAFSVLFDILSLTYLEAPFRRGHQIPFPMGAELAKFAIFNLVGGACLIATVVNLRRVSKLDAATGAVLREYKEVFKTKRNAMWRLRAGYAHYFDAIKDDDMSVGVWIEEQQVRTSFAFSDPAFYADVVHAISRNRIDYSGKIIPDRDNRVIALSEEIHDNSDRIEHAIREHYRLQRIMRSLRGRREQLGSEVSDHRAIACREPGSSGDGSKVADTLNPASRSGSEA